MARNPLAFARALCLLLVAFPVLASGNEPRVEGIQPMPQEAIDSFNALMDSSNSGYDSPAKLLKGYTPIYPVTRLLSGKEGVCRVAFTIGIDGKPANPEPDEEADAKMCDHALYALQYWEFEPATRQGEPAESRIRVPFEYSLDR